jgi:hypothetical protein
VAVPKWFFAMSGFILVVVGVGLLALRTKPKYERGLARYLNVGTLWPATVIAAGLAFVALGLGIVPFPRWR